MPVCVTMLQSVFFFSLDKNFRREIFLGLTTACNKSTSMFVIVVLENCVRKQLVFFTTNIGI